MKAKIIFGIALVLFVESMNSMTIQPSNNAEQVQHFHFKTENGQSRTEDIKYNNTINEVITKSDEQQKQQNLTTTTPGPVEYKGGYSFISADDYEYTVLYKANKNGFYPYVTARKLHNDKV